MRPFHLNQTIASSAPADPDDTVSTKRALHTLDLYKFRDHENTRQTSPYPNTEMFEGLKILQQRNHQRIDGRMEPGGPTARMLQAELDAKSGATNTYPPFALGRTIGDRGRNARADLVRARPILELLGGPMRDNGEPDEHDINNRIRSIQHLLNLPPSGTIEPGDVTHRTVAKATGRLAGIPEPETGPVAGKSNPDRDTVNIADWDTGLPRQRGNGPQEMLDMMNHQTPMKDGEQTLVPAPASPRMAPREEALEEHRDRNNTDNEDEFAEIPLHARTLLDPDFDQPIDPSKSGELENFYRLYEFDPERDTQLDVLALYPIDAIRVKNMGKEIEALATSWTSKPPRPGRRVLSSAEANAVQHALWSYRMTMKWNYENSKIAGDAHEVDSANTRGDTLKDLHNNEIGRRLALNPKNEGNDDIDVILGALDDGKLRVRDFDVIGDLPDNKSSISPIISTY